MNKFKVNFVSLFLLVVAVCSNSLAAYSQQKSAVSEQYAQNSLIDDVVSGQGSGSIAWRLNSQYSKDGVGFVLNKNWKVAIDDQLGNGVRFIAAVDAQGAELSLAFFSLGSGPDPSGFGDLSLERSKKYLDGGTLTLTGETPIARRLKRIEIKGTAKGYTITRAGQSVAHTADLFAVRTENYDVIVMLNAPNAQKSAADKVFVTLMSTLIAR